MTGLDTDNFDEFKKFVKDESMYQFWSRCEYEILLVDWPCKKISEKWDIYKQIMGAFSADVPFRLILSKRDFFNYLIKGG